MPIGEVRCGLENSRGGGLQGMSSLELSPGAATVLLQGLPSSPLLLKLRGYPHSARPRNYILVRPSSDGLTITTIARAHCDGATETTATGPGGDDSRAPAGEARDARDACSAAGFG